MPIGAFLTLFQLYHVQTNTKTDFYRIYKCACVMHLITVFCSFCLSCFCQMVLKGHEISENEPGYLFFFKDHNILYIFYR